MYQTRLQTIWILMKKMPRIGGKNPHEDFTRDDENPVMKTNKIDADYWSFYGLLFSGPRYKKNQG